LGNEGGDALFGVGEAVPAGHGPVGLGPVTASNSEPPQSRADTRRILCRSNIGSGR
jgi:hypothetical protein